MRVQLPLVMSWLFINSLITRSVYESYPQRQIATDCLATEATNVVRHRYCNRKPNADRQSNQKSAREANFRDNFKIEIKVLT